MTKVTVLGTQQNALDLPFSQGIRLRFGSF
jgi:hypothetical protein